MPHSYGTLNNETFITRRHNNQIVPGIFIEIENSTFIIEVWLDKEVAHIIKPNTRKPKIIL